MSVQLPLLELLYYDIISDQAPIHILPLPGSCVLLQMTECSEYHPSVNSDQDSLVVSDFFLNMCIVLPLFQALCLSFTWNQSPVSVSSFRSSSKTFCLFFGSIGIALRCVCACVCVCVHVCVRACVCMNDVSVHLNLCLLNL